MFTPPARNGLAASHLQLPAGPWPTVLTALAAHFSSVPHAVWQSRFARGLVLSAEGAALNEHSPYRQGALIHYYREVPAEVRIPFEETVLYEDEHLLVADKPHFLPVTPAGSFVDETLLARLVRQTNNPQLVPLHRIDRGTAGLVLFSVNPESRSAYQALFREQRMRKYYEAIAAPLLQHSFPYVYRSRLAAGEPFFRMQEVPGIPNTETAVRVLARGNAHWHYALKPVTGRKHQLRVHMAALGAAIVNDDFYPHLAAAAVDDHSRPLQLLARALQFDDPLSGKAQRFESQLRLDWALG